MANIETYSEVVGALLKGREVEFSYQGVRYGIVLNNADKWMLIGSGQLLSDITDYEDIIKLLDDIRLDGRTFKELIDVGLIKIEMIY